MSASQANNLRFDEAQTVKEILESEKQVSLEMMQDILPGKIEKIRKLVNPDNHAYYLAEFRAIRDSIQRRLKYQKDLKEKALARFRLFSGSSDSGAAETAAAKDCSVFKHSSEYKEACDSLLEKTSNVIAMLKKTYRTQ